MSKPPDLYISDEPTIYPTAEQVEAEKRREQEYIRRNAARAEARAWPMRFTPAASLRAYASHERFWIELREADDELDIVLGWRAGRRLIEASESPVLVKSLAHAAPPPKKNGNVIASFNDVDERPVSVTVFNAPEGCRFDMVHSDVAEESRGISLVFTHDQFEHIVDELYAFLSAPPFRWREACWSV
jgi:hypothetical protein